MKLLIPIALVCALSAHAQRGGGMGGARGGMGGGVRGGMGSPGVSGGFRGGMGSPGVSGGFRGGIGTFRPGRGFGPAAGRLPSIGRGFHGFRGIRGSGAFVGLGWSGWGLGWGWGLGNYGCPYSYPCSSYVQYPYIGGYWPGYSDVAPVQYGYSYSQPPVTVVYPPQPAPVERARPVTREYDESGREIEPQPASNSSPIYLFAFQDQSIRAASSYRIEGNSLHYVTLQNEEKQASLDNLDRALTLQLNRERRVSVRLP